MTHPFKLLCWLSGALVLQATARAAVAEAAANPYQAIPASNVFHLQPVVVRVPEPPPIPLPKIVFAGLTTFNGKRVLLKVWPPASSGEQAKEWSCILSEGERSGPIEVLAIDAGAGSVKVNNSSTIMVLTLAKDGPVLRNTQLPPGPPPVPLQPVGRSR